MSDKSSADQRLQNPQQSTTFEGTTGGGLPPFGVGTAGGIFPPLGPPPSGSGCADGASSASSIWRSNLITPSARKVRLHAKAGFLVIEGSVFAYRYQDSTGQLSIMNREGAGLFAPLSGEDAREALAAIEDFPNA
jgi:hypothetical protein